MKQEEVIKNVENKDFELENNKKKLIIFVVLMFLAGLYYYYYYYSSSSPEQSVISDKTEQSEKNIKQLAEKASTSSKTDLLKEKIVTVKNEVVKKEESEPEFFKDEKFKPTDKFKLISSAVKASGKRDPFSFDESNFIPFDIQTDASDFPTPPMRNSSKIFEINSSDVLNTPQIENSAERILLKGFLGDKILVEISNFVYALEKNEIKKGVKVININSQDLTAKFEIKGKLVTKTLKRDNDPKNNKNVDLVKNLNK